MIAPIKQKSNQEDNPKELSEERIRLLEEAEIQVPPGVNDDSFMTAEDIQKLSDFLMDSFGPEFEMTPKAKAILDLLYYLGDS